MGIAAKHAYRFGFLKSERWQLLRLQCLVRDKSMCRVCGKADPSNDAHHIMYPGNWIHTTLFHIRTVCRDCHEKIHAEMKANPKFKWSNVKFHILPEGHPKKMRGHDHARKYYRKAHRNLLVMLATGAIFQNEIQKEIDYRELYS